MRTVVKRLGFSYVVGQKRNIAADAAGTVKFREEYLLKKVANRDHHRNPRRLEVFLDESYVNEHHVASRTWLPANRVRYAKRGKGRRFCIVGAGILHRKNGGLRGDWVENSLKVWQSDLAASEQEDYHGNFDSETFEDWFKKLCRTLKREHGACNIVMDGASYHRRIIKPSPKKGWKKAHILRWLVENGIPWGSDTRNATLLKLASAAKPKTNYAANIIAQKYGHLLFYTPPYHPELQPIEVIWGVVKNRIAMEPAKSMSDLKKKLGASLRQVSSHTWVGAYRKVQRMEDEYMVKVRHSQENRRESAEAAAQLVEDAVENTAHDTAEEPEDYIFHC